MQGLLHHHITRGLPSVLRSLGRLRPDSTHCHSACVQTLPPEFDTRRVVENDVMKAKVTDAMALFESDPEPTYPLSDTVSSCTCGQNGGCGCAWTGPNKEHCDNDDGTPCWASCCYHDARDQQSSSPCRGVCNEEEATSSQSCYEQQCTGCPLPTWNNQVPEACADCAEQNCKKSDLISQWAVQKALETKPERSGQVIRISACLSAGVVLMLVFGILISRFRKEPGQSSYAIASHDEDGGKTTQKQVDTSGVFE